MNTPYRFAVLILMLSACSTGSPPDYVPAEGEDAQGHTAATVHTARANAAVAEGLALDDPQDFEDAKRGLVARLDSLTAQRSDDGRTVWDQDAYAFIDGQAPASVNPSLWRQAKLNNIHGLFKVTDGVYQLRGFDLANLSIIEGDSGLILVDPLTTVETASVAWDFIQQHFPNRPIKAIIFTHSHIDHFGGVAGVVSAEQVREQGIRVIAPEGFIEEAVSENVMAGIAMQRRAGYMYGRRLARSERGHVDTGLGKEPPMAGTVGILAPTELVSRTGQEMQIDGKRFVFQYAPESEAPAELTFYLPELKAFCGAEVLSRNLHNIYTLRGAKVRDALRWSGYIEEARELFGEAEVYFASHHWPIWGHQRIDAFLRQQRDVYKFIHDQSLRLANQGYTPREIAETIRLPESLRKNFSTRGYYGTVKHNAKAVYQAYFGWYDANPANLDPLPPVEAGQGYVQLAGGEAPLLQQAQAAFDAGNYRWASELLNHLVFANPEHEQGKKLLAASYDQLGYQAESGPWRDVYLSAAFELRHGGTREGVSVANAIDLVRQVPLSKTFDSMAARVNPDKVEGKDLALRFVFPDIDESYRLYLENSVLHHAPSRDGDGPVDATLTISHELFLKLVVGTAGLKETLLSDDLDVDGSRLKLLGFLAGLDKPDGTFNIVTP